MRKILIDALKDEESCQLSTATIPSGLVPEGYNEKNPEEQRRIGENLRC